MADKNTYTMDAKQAIEEFDRLAKSAHKYGDQIVRLNRLTGTLVTQSEHLKATFKVLEDGVKASAHQMNLNNKRLERMGLAAKEGASGVRSFQKALDKIVTAMISLAQSLNAAAKGQFALTQEEKKAADAATRQRIALELLTAARTKSWANLSKEALEYVKNHTTTVRLREAMKLIEQQMIKNTEGVYKHTDALKRAEQVERVYAAVLAGTTAALSLEDQAMLKNLQTKGLQSRLQSEINRKMFADIDLKNRDAIATAKLTNVESLLAYAVTKNKAALTDEARVMLTNITAAEKMAKATAILKAQMTGKNVVLDKQGNLVRQDSAAMRTWSQTLAPIEKVWTRFRQIMLNFVGYGGLFYLWRRGMQSIGDARELEDRISEIRTISDRAAVSVTQWRTELIALSSSYGVDAAEAAEAAYNALSDQVVEATDTFVFLRNEMNLSLVAVSSLDAATKATSAIINSFGLTSADAARLNEIFFKSVDLGRFRLEDIGEHIGRVSILSDQLGVSFLEQQAALSLLSRKGIPASEAMTLLRNVMQKMIRPTEHARELFASWGFTSGAAAIKGLGLVGVMSRLAQHAKGTGDSAAEMGEIFGRMRAIIGAAGLTMEEFTAEMAKYDNASETTLAALEERLNSTSQKINIFEQTAKNFFINVFGTNAILALARFVDAHKALNTTFAEWLHWGARILQWWASYRIALFAITGLLVPIIKGIYAMAAALRTMTTAAIQAKVALFALNIAIGLITLGLTYLIASSAGSGIDKMFADMEFDAAIADIEANFDRMNQLDLARLESKLGAQTTAIERDVADIGKTLSLVVANFVRENEQAAKDIEDAWKELDDVFKEQTKNALQGIEDMIKANEKAAEELEKKSNAEAQQKLTGEKAAEAIRVSMEQIDAITNPSARLSQRQTLLDGLVAMEVAAIRAGETVLVEEYRKLQDDIMAQMERDLQEALEAARKAKVMQGVTYEGTNVPVIVKSGARRGLQQLEEVEKPDEAAIAQFTREINSLHELRNKIIAERLTLQDQEMAKTKEQAEFMKKKAEEQRDLLVKLRGFVTTIEAVKPEDVSKASLSEMRVLLTQMELVASQLQLPAEKVFELMKAPETRVKEMETELKRQEKAAIDVELQQRADAAVEEMKRLTTLQQEQQHDAQVALTATIPKANAEMIGELLKTLERAFPPVGFWEKGVWSESRIEGNRLRNSMQGQVEFLKKLLQETEDIKKLDEGEEKTARQQKLQQQLEEFLTVTYPLIEKTVQEQVTQYGKGAGGMVLPGAIMQADPGAPKPIEQIQDAKDLFNIEKDALMIGKKTIKEIQEEYKKLKQSFLDSTKLLAEGLQTAKDLEKKRQDLKKFLDSLPPEAKNVIPLPGQPQIDMGKPGDFEKNQKLMEELYQERLKKDVTYTFGDINITTPQGTTHAQVTYIAKQLQRAIRQGLISV